MPSAKVGLPEVLIGIMPGGGGTQRLPRLIGPKAALEMIVSGRHVPAEEAKRLGIIDELVEEGADLRQAAIAMASRIADMRPLPRIRDHDEQLAEAEADPGLFDAMRKSIARRARNQKAPYHCIEAVEAACKLPFDDGISASANCSPNSRTRPRRAPCATPSSPSARWPAARHARGHAAARRSRPRPSSAPARWAAASR